MRYTISLITILIPKGTQLWLQKPEKDNPFSMDSLTQKMIQEEALVIYCPETGEVQTDSYDTEMDGSIPELHIKEGVTKHELFIIQEVKQILQSWHGNNIVPDWIEEFFKETNYHTLTKNIDQIYEIALRTAQPTHKKQPFSLSLKKKESYDPETTKETYPVGFNLLLEAKTYKDHESLSEELKGFKIVGIPKLDFQKSHEEALFTKVADEDLFKKVKRLTETILNSKPKTPINKEMETLSLEIGHDPKILNTK